MSAPYAAVPVPSVCHGFVKVYMPVDALALLDAEEAAWVCWPELEDLYPAGTRSADSTSFRRRARLYAGAVYHRDLNVLDLRSCMREKPDESDDDMAAAVADLGLRISGFGLGVVNDQ